VNSVQQASIPLPLYKEQIRLKEVFSELDNEIEFLSTNVSLLNYQKKGLMQQLLTGKTRVKVDDT
jgi:type I restriction enzyme S subunit